jgi:hypothetical protein
MAESSVFLRSPVRVVPDPIRGSPNVLIMCEVLNPDATPHATNTRAPLLALIDDDVRAQAPLYGFEQEYTMLTKQGTVYGWPAGGPLSVYPWTIRGPCKAFCALQGDGQQSLLSAFPCLAGFGILCRLSVGFPVPGSVWDSLPSVCQLSHAWQRLACSAVWVLLFLEEAVAVIPLHPAPAGMSFMPL